MPLLQAGGRRLLKDDAEKAAKKERGEKQKKAVGGRKKQEARPPLEPGQKMYMVVGFEVVACSIRREPGKPINKNLMCPQSLDDPNGPEPQEVKKGGWVGLRAGAVFVRPPLGEILCVCLLGSRTAAGGQGGL